MSVSEPKLSIVIPALNEAKRIGSTLDALANYLEETAREASEVLIVIANSKDATLEIAHQKLGLFKNARIIETGPAVGKGHQVRIGMLEATGSHRLFMDADMATPLHHIDAVVNKLNDGADVVIAVRDLAVIHTGLRKYISEMSNLVSRIILLLPYKDTQCGFKAFKSESARFLFERQKVMRWVFDMEILAIARKSKFRIETVFAEDWTDVPEGTFQKIGLRDTFSTLLDVLLIRWRLWTGVYR